MNHKTPANHKKALLMLILSCFLFANFSVLGTHKTLADTKSQSPSLILLSSKKDTKASSSSSSKASSKKKEKKAEAAAEKAVKALEEKQTDAALKTASKKVKQVGNKKVKTKLNSRIEVVKASMAESQAEASAESAVKYLEDNQSRDYIADAQNKTNALSNEDKKAELNNRIGLVENAIAAREAQDQAINDAETAVQYLENNQSRDYIADAQNKTDAVSDENKKAELNNRIGLVENAIAAREAQEAAATQQVTEDRDVYVTGGGKSNVYWYGTDRMPWNTNKDNLVIMKESEAIAQGKRHSKTE